MTEQERKEYEVKLASKERAYQPYVDNKAIIDAYRKQEAEINEELKKLKEEKKDIDKKLKSDNYDFYIEDLTLNEVENVNTLQGRINAIREERANAVSPQERKTGEELLREIDDIREEVRDLELQIESFEETIRELNEKLFRELDDEEYRAINEQINEAQESVASLNAKEEELLKREKSLTSEINKFRVKDNAYMDNIRSKEEELKETKRRAIERVKSDKEKRLVVIAEKIEKLEEKKRTLKEVEGPMYQAALDQNKDGAEYYKKLGKEIDKLRVKLETPVVKEEVEEKEESEELELGLPEIPARTFLQHGERVIKVLREAAKLISEKLHISGKEELPELPELPKYEEKEEIVEEAPMETESEESKLDLPEIPLRTPNVFDLNVEEEPAETKEDDGVDYSFMEKINAHLNPEQTSEELEPSSLPESEEDLDVTVDDIASIAEEDSNVEELEPSLEPMASENIENQDFSKELQPEVVEEEPVYEQIDEAKKAKMQKELVAFLRSYKAQAEDYHSEAKKYSDDNMAGATIEDGPEVLQSNIEYLKTIQGIDDDLSSRIPKINSNLANDEEVNELRGEITSIQNETQDMLNSAIERKTAELQEYEKQLKEKAEQEKNDAEANKALQEYYQKRNEEESKEDAEDIIKVKK